MENKEQKQQNRPLMDDVVSHMSANHSRYLVVVLIVGLVSGFIGGAFGGTYALKNPTFQKYFGQETVAGNVSQTVVLEEESAVVDVVKEASPAVVSIVVTQDLSRSAGFGYDPFFPFFGSPQENGNEPNLQQVGAGSGFFVSADGLILTNKHVVSEETADYTVITEDGEEYRAEVVARDPRNDLAILKVEIQNAPFLTLAESDKIQIGQKVVAIGYSLGQYENTVTSGVVSGMGRSVTAGSSEGIEQLEGVIQTDAAINPGNSGGPLLNTAAQVIGINTAVDRQGQLVGFAIPSNDAAKALESYEKNGKIIRPFLGIRYVMVNKALAERQSLGRDYGALLISGDLPTEFAVVPGSPAEDAGLKENDIILEVDGEKLSGETTIARILRNKNVDDTISLKVFSEGQEKTVRVTLVEAK
jgi:serine protease Do